GRQLTPENAIVAWRKAAIQMAENEHEPSPEKVIELSGRYRITGYDANFIALAMEMGIRCVTEDGALRRKFPEIALNMKDFVELGQTRGEVRETRATYRGRRRKAP
ncbi:MAG: type II toxin-antitoxin system VapC family toxin, partial [Candidatus Aureabacteria bacterium]|nr:type II toxin-antitoxin system VapC family toxin [Candidatus Auribacterota bacterium]